MRPRTTGPARRRQTAIPCQGGRRKGVKRTQQQARQHESHGIRYSQMANQNGHGRSHYEKQQERQFRIHSGPFLRSRFLSPTSKVGRDPLCSLRRVSCYLGPTDKGKSTRPAEAAAHVPGTSQSMSRCSSSCSTTSCSAKASSCSRSPAIRRPTSNSRDSGWPTWSRDYRARRSEGRRGDRPFRSPAHPGCRNRACMQFCVNRSFPKGQSHFCGVLPQKSGQSPLTPRGPCTVTVAPEWALAYSTSTST